MSSSFKPGDIVEYNDNRLPKYGILLKESELEWRPGKYWSVLVGDTICVTHERWFKPTNF